MGAQEGARGGRCGPAFGFGSFLLFGPKRARVRWLATKRLVAELLKFLPYLSPADAYLPHPSPSLRQEWLRKQGFSGVSRKEVGGGRSRGRTGQWLRSGDRGPGPRRGEAASGGPGREEAKESCRTSGDRRRAAEPGRALPPPPGPRRTPSPPT